VFNQVIHQEELNSEVINYIKELETKSREYQYKYLEIKEQYDLLIYKRFARSAEQLLADEKQQPLFAEEAREAETTEEAEPEELSEVKLFKRGKAGRKPLSAILRTMFRLCCTFLFSMRQKSLDWILPHLMYTKISVKYNTKERKRWERKVQNAVFTRRNSRPKR
jgi:hypothetical protein